MNNEYNILDFELSKIIVEKAYHIYNKEYDKAFRDNTALSELKSNIKIDPDQGAYLIMIGVIIYSNEEKEKTIIDIEYSYRFTLINEETFNKEKFLNISLKLASMLIGVSYSTFRGNFFERMNNSSYDNFSPLPIINPQAIAKHQFNFDKEDLLTNEEEE